MCADIFILLILHSIYYYTTSTFIYTYSRNIKHILLQAKYFNEQYSTYHSNSAEHKELYRRNEHTSQYKSQYRAIIHIISIKERIHSS